MSVEFHPPEHASSHVRIDDPARDAQREELLPWRHLTTYEITTLKSHGNASADWCRVLVCDPFDPTLVRDCQFSGLVRIGRLEHGIITANGITKPTGLHRATIIDCDLDHGVTAWDVGCLERVLVGRDCAIINVGCLRATGKPFGCGGSPTGAGAERQWLEVGNENGRRAVLAFPEMLPADAMLWARERADGELLARLAAMTDEIAAARQGSHGKIGPGVAITNCGRLEDVEIAAGSILDGADLLRDVVILHGAGSPVMIGEGVTLEQAIVGPGSRVVAGARARGVVLGEHVTLDLAARVYQSLVGDNSTIACAEVGHALIAPFHEQHHNNSFVIATTLAGQSNVAAGATIGSNHNSRAKDGEIIAGRGFWPGLCSNFKHPSRFASFTLVAKGNYPHELDVPTPFSLVANSDRGDELLLMPGYWWLHNLYALMRNEWKFRARDKRRLARQRIVSDCLAPDTVEELFAGLGWIEQWIGEAFLRRAELPIEEAPREDRRMIGAKLLREEAERLDKLDVFAGSIENSKRPARVLKARRAHALYRELINFYAVRVLVDYVADESRGEDRADRLAEYALGGRETQWINLGGQLIPGGRFQELKRRVLDGELRSWQDIHGEYERCWACYEDDRARHAAAALGAVHGWREGFTAGAWRAALEAARSTQQWIARATLDSREKDFSAPFRRITVSSDAEFDAVFGRVEDDDFIGRVGEQAALFIARVDTILGAL